MVVREMPKQAAEITTNGRAVFYAVLWPSFRQAAIDVGWSLGLHGSMASDMDMMAMPWTEDAVEEPELIAALSACIGKTVWTEYHFKPFYGKPFGRVVYTLSIGSDWYIDLSVMPKQTVAGSIVDVLDDLLRELGECDTGGTVWCSVHQNKRCRVDEIARRAKELIAQHRGTPS
jgi:hypothetical protein